VGGAREVNVRSQNWCMHSAFCSLQAAAWQEFAIVVILCIQWCMLLLLRIVLARCAVQEPGAAVSADAVHQRARPVQLQIMQLQGGLVAMQCC
jgi:ABC-type sulfate transport system permease subunit